MLVAHFFLQTSSDVICLVYDSSNPRSSICLILKRLDLTIRSFEYCARIYLRYFSTTQLPVLVVANKSDKGVVRQDYILQVCLGFLIVSLMLISLIWILKTGFFSQPEAFCAKHKLPPPQKASARLVPAKDIFLKLATMAAFP